MKHKLTPMQWAVVATLAFTVLSYEIAVIPWRQATWTQDLLEPAAAAQQACATHLRTCNDELARRPQPLPAAVPEGAPAACEFAVNAATKLERGTAWSTVLTCPGLAGRRARGEVKGQLRVICDDGENCAQGSVTASLTMLFGRATLSVADSADGRDSVTLEHETAEEFRVPLSGQLPVRIEVQQCAHVGVVAASAAHAAARIPAPAATTHAAELCELMPGTVVRIIPQ